MHLMMPPLSVLAHLVNNPTEMFIGPTPHQLFVSLPDGRIAMFIVEENLNEMSPEEVNRILQREITLAQ